MILYVVMETAEKYMTGNWHHQKVVLEEASGELCLMVHYKQLNRAMLAEIGPHAIVYSGASTPFEDYDVRKTRAYRDVVMNSDIPQLGICGGHQLASEFFGCTLGIMRQTRTHEPDHNPKYHPGQFKEWGVYPVTVLQKDPLFRGLGRIIKVSSNPGELVLDPFSGSATTVSVAKKLGRQFVAFDISDEYITRGMDRLSKIEPGDALDGAPEPKVSAPATPSKGVKKGKNSPPKKKVTEVSLLNWDN